MTAILRATATFAFLAPIRLVSFAPALEGRTSPDNGQQDVRGFEQISPNLMVAAFGDAASSVDLAGLIMSWCQAEIGTDVGGMSEASGVVDGNDEGQSGQGTDTGNGVKVCT